MSDTQLGVVIRHIRRLRTSKGTGTGSDDELVAAFSARNDQAAFAGLVRRYGPLVLGVCRRVLRQEQDAEDAFQATFLVLARRAGAIRKRDSLSSWLHGVAYRVAMRARQQAARRRVHEGQAKAAAPGDPSWQAAWQEVQVILDEEVHALPEKYRAAFVLCVLEGCPQAEAARRLGVKEGTVWSRLAQARKLLQDRLARRGVALSAVLAATALAASRAPAVSAPLTAAAVKAATLFASAGAVPADTVAANVLGLAKGVQKTMFPTTIKTTALLLLTAGAVALSLGAALHGYADARPAAVAQEPTPEPPAAAGAPKAPPAAPKAEADTVEVSGQVLGPDGKPFAGARLVLWTSAVKKHEDLSTKSTTGADGRFRFAVTRDDLRRDAKVVATAKGYGPDFVPLTPEGRPAELMLRLVEDDVPIEGRILDLEGKPLAGTAVQVFAVEKRAEDGDLKPWIEAAKERARDATPKGVPMTTISPAAPGLPASVWTDKDGTFRLTGCGRERVVRLAVREPDFEYADLTVLTTRAAVDGALAAQGVHGPTFKHLAVPGRPVVGIVRDKRTSKPLAGILVVGNATIQADRRFRPLGTVVRATTDDQGRYRLAGLGKHEHYHLEAGAVPYFSQRKPDVKGAPALEPLTVDFDLEQGVVVRGFLTDRATGKPVPGWVSCAALVSNPNLKDFTGQWQPADGGRVAADGSFAVVAVPGPGLLFVHPQDTDRYARTEVGDDETLRRDLAALDRRTTPSRFHAAVRINPSEKDAKSTTRDIALEPGQTRTGTVLGPDGKRLPGAFAGGLSPTDVSRVPPLKLEAATFTAAGLSKHTPRPLFFFHPEKRLSKLEWVKGDGAGPISVRLEPPGELTGRVVDAAGRPLAGLRVHPYFEDVVVNKHIPFEFLEPSSPLRRETTNTDADGKFRLEGLIPGLKYHLIASGGGLGERFVDLAREQSVESSKVKGLGDLKIQEPAKAEKEKEQ